MTFLSRLGDSSVVFRAAKDSYIKAEPSKVASPE